MQPILEVNHVVKRYADKVALNEVSLKVPKGSIYGLLGPNGAGKTSLIRIINQITMPDSGEILLGGKPLAPIHVRNIGYMPEERGLYKSMKVGEQAMYLAMLKGLSKEQAKKQLDYWFDKFDIQPWWGKKIEELSKGMAQKIQFIVTVLHQPDLLILDEPFSGFDPVNANIIKDEIIELKNKGTTIIFSTHRMESVEEMCDDIALIHQGNKVIEGPLLEVKKEHRTFLYQVGIISNDVQKLLLVLAEKYNFTPTTFKSLNNEVQIEVQIVAQNSVNDLLMLLTQYGQVTHFSEKLPTVNDIFIQTVSK